MRHLDPLVERILREKGWRCKHCRARTRPGHLVCNRCYERQLDDRGREEEVERCPTPR